MVLLDLVIENESSIAIKQNIGFDGEIVFAKLPCTSGFR